MKLKYIISRRVQRTKNSSPFLDPIQDVKHTSIPNDFQSKEYVIKYKSKQFLTLNSVNCTFDQLQSVKSKEQLLLSHYKSSAAVFLPTLLLPKLIVQAVLGS